jgi:hypothetical protein
MSINQFTMIENPVSLTLAAFPSAKLNEMVPILIGLDYGNLSYLNTFNFYISDSMESKFASF